MASKLNGVQVLLNGTLTSATTQLDSLAQLTESEVNSTLGVLRQLAVADVSGQLSSLVDRAISNVTVLLSSLEQVAFFLTLSHPPACSRKVMASNCIHCYFSSYRLCAEITAEYSNLCLARVVNSFTIYSNQCKSHGTFWSVSKRLH